MSIYLAMNNRSTFENKSVCIATCRHIKCLSERKVNVSVQQIVALVILGKVERGVSGHDTGPR